MYPFARLILTTLRARRQPRLSLLGVHVSQHRCWPIDLDMFLEMNNGRVLTLLDLGRTGLSVRMGLTGVMTRERWGVAVAGGSTRYRKRIRPFAAFEMRTRCIGWDDRFVYMEQTLWLGPDCAFQGLLRTCVTDRNGIVPTARVLAALGETAASPALPDWVLQWIAADATRPWPPERPA
jgi:acyl-CoA thioesterase FadM